MEITNIIGRRNPYQLNIRFFKWVRVGCCGTPTELRERCSYVHLVGSSKFSMATAIFGHCVHQEALY
jgi:hypothetical protein